MSEKTALVAGGLGFIGSHLCEYLLAKNYRVYAIDNLVTGRRENVEHLFSNTKFSWIEHDIIVPLFMNVPCHEIYNLASPASPVDFKRIPDYILKTSAIGHMNLLDWARTQKARILFASTSEVYGDPQVHPQIESYLGNVDCAGPRGCYDEAKRYGEALTQAYKVKYGINTRVVRIFNTYGPRMRAEDGRVIPNFFSQALKGLPLSIYGDGMQTRSLCFVDDLVEGIFRLMQSQVDTPTNIGSPAEYTVLEIAKNVCLACEVDFKTDFLPLPPSDPKLRRPDISKAQRELNWNPMINLKEGFQRTLVYFKGHGG